MKRSGILILMIGALVGSCTVEQDQSADAAAESGAITAAQRTTVDPADLIDCEVTDRPMTDFDCRRARNALGRVEQGVGGINWPEKFVKSREQTIYLTVGRNQMEHTPPPLDQTALEQTAEAEPGDWTSHERHSAESAADAPPPPAPHPPPVPSRETVPYQPLVGRFMSAELKAGTAFEITPSGPVSQELPPGGETVWAWNVKPLRGGAHTLTIVTRVEFEDTAGNRIPLRSSTTSKTISVDVDPVDQARAFLEAAPGWLKLLTALLGAATALMVAWFGFRKALANRSAADQPPESD